MLRLTLATAAVIGASTLAPAAHAASPTCDGMPKGGLPYGILRDTPTSAIFGVYSRIERRIVDLCGDNSTGPSSSSGWSMVTADSENGQNTMWAQSGWTRDGTGFDDETPGGVIAFSQFTLKCNATASCTGDITVETDYGAAIPEGSNYIYRSVQESSDNRIHMYANGAQLAETNYNPEGDWDAAWDNQFAGETFHVGTDMPGTTGDKMDFDRLQYYNSAGTRINVSLATMRVGSAESSRYQGEYWIPAAGNGDIGWRMWTDPISCTNVTTCS
jgi:hypothetical protein